MGSVAALIVAGGSGTRFGGDVPKQYSGLAGTPILRRTAEALRACPALSPIQVVIGTGHERLYREAVSGLPLPPPITGGETRQESVRRGLEVLANSARRFVLIHDAARPLVSRELVETIVAELERGAEAVLPLLRISDSLRRQESDTVGTAIRREGICRAQTPQGFVYRAIREAHAQFAGSGASDDIALAETAGMKITAVPGEEANIKITTPADLAFAERLIAGNAETRVGTGFDVHRFSAGDHIWLCGVRIAHERGLEGHSDADAGLHALTDAILGALAAGDIGQHFPPSEERWRGAPSRIFLERAAEMVKQRGGAILNCDITLVCERPKIGAHREAMRAAIAEILHVGVARISIKATTTEGLGFTGRGEGLAAQAVATIRLPA